jgi:hypothetical protein
MPKIKDEKNAIDKLVDSVKNSSAIVDDTPEASIGYATQDELMSMENRLVTVMSDLFKKRTDVHHDLAGQAPVIPGNEIGADTRGIEPVAANDLIPQAKLESFMDQLLTIYVHPSADKESNPVLIPSVNGINQPIFRGRDSRVKRKFVEALARNRHTGYEQVVPNITRPHKYIMRPSMVVKDPFTVKNDPHPRGPQWLQNILSEA